MLAVIKKKSGEEDDEGEDDEEEDEEDDDEDEEDEDDATEQENDSDSDDAESEPELDEQFTDSLPASKDLVEKVSSALGDHAANSGDESDLDMDEIPDEDMANLDKKLVEAFKA